MDFGNALMDKLAMLRSLKCIKRPTELGNSFIRFPFNFRTRKQLKFNNVLPSTTFLETNVRNRLTSSFEDAILGTILPSDSMNKYRM